MARYRCFSAVILQSEAIIITANVSSVPGSELSALPVSVSTNDTSIFEEGTKLNDHTALKEETKALLQSTRNY